MVNVIPILSNHKNSLDFFPFLLSLSTLVRGTTIDE